MGIQIFTLLPVLSSYIYQQQYQIKWLLSSGKVVEVQSSDTCYKALDSEGGRNTKQMKVVEAIKSMVGI